MARVLVTGATGLIGNSLVRHLLGQGADLRALVRAGSDPRPLEGLAVERAVGDVRDPASLERAAAGVSVVYHAAGWVVIGTRGLAQARAVNVAGTRAVARAARAAGARLVHVSSVDTLGEDPSAVPYVISKREAEAAVQSEIALGLDAVIVNPAFTVGPWDWKPSSGRLLLAAARGLARIAAPGGNDFCHGADVAAGIVAAGERGRRGERYVLSGESLSYRRAFEMIAVITGGPRPLLTAPALAVRAAGWCGTAFGAVTGREPDFNAASAAFGCEPHHFDDARARAELGYRPRPAREAFGDAWVWLVERGYARGRN